MRYINKKSIIKSILILFTFSSFNVFALNNSIEKQRESILEKSLFQNISISDVDWNLLDLIEINPEITESLVYRAISINTDDLREIKTHQEVMMETVVGKEKVNFKLKNIEQLNELGLLKFNFTGFNNDRMTLFVKDNYFIEGIFIHNNEKNLIKINDNKGYMYHF